MSKKITGLIFALWFLLIACVTTFSVSASFATGEVLTITEKAGGGVYYNGTNNRC